jgi:TPR repeat protein
LAEQGDPEAQWDIGSFYLWDLGDSFWASSTQEVIATDGPPDYAEAANWLRKAAEQGHASSQLDLGSMYCKGEGAARDYAEAARWYVKAAEQGDSEAQFRIGELYTHGQGVEQDHIKAAEWHKEAAKQGHGLAQFNIGVMYQNGDGVEQDYSLAARWYRLAAERRGEDPPTFDPRLEFCTFQGS